MEAKALLAEQIETFAFVLEASNDSVEATAVFPQFATALSMSPHVLMDGPDTQTTKKERSQGSAMTQN